LVKNDSGDPLADSHNILNRWKNYFSHILNVHRVSDGRQREIHTAKPLVPGPSPFEVETAIAKLKKYKPPGTDRILVALIQAGGETCSEIHELIDSIWNKEELSQQWKSLLLHQFTRRAIKLTVVITEATRKT
jgi:hypothetical protein